MNKTDSFAPMAGIRVIEVSHMIFGPSCGLFLAALGAEVIKVEPIDGDKTRQLTGMGASFFPTFNRGKKSVALDMKTSEGRKAFSALLASANVLVENFRDGSLAKMGLDPDSLRIQYPQLIIVACKGFLHGPYEQRAALDEVVQMMTGLAYMTGPPGRPLRVGSSANDIMGGLFGAIAVLGALREQDQTGTGRTIRVGLFENSLLLVAQHMVQYAMLGIEPEPMPNRAFSWPVYDIFDSKDGKQLFIGAVTENHWISLCKLLELFDFVKDPQLSTRMDRIAARSWTFPIIAEAVNKQHFKELTKVLEQAGIPYAPVMRPAEMYDDIQANAGTGMPESTLPSSQKVKIPGMPIEVDGKRVEKQMDVPGLGIDTSNTLCELGFDEAFIARASGSDKRKVS